MAADPRSPLDGISGLAAAYTAEADASAARIPIEKRQPTWLWRVLSAWLLSTEAWLRSHGGTRLRFGIRAFWGFIAIGGIVLLLGPVINAPLTLDDITGSAQTATERWIARNFDASYRIGRDSHGQLTARVDENIGAYFPAKVNESGIQRVIATDYQGHSLDPSAITATLDGKPVRVTNTASPTRLTVTLDAGHRLAGDHRFVLRYTLHNLAYSTTDPATGRATDLLEWDVFGPSWPQAFTSLDVSVIVPKDLDGQLVRRPRGELEWLIIGAGQWLAPEQTSSGDVRYEFSNHQTIPPHANAGFDLYFEPGTFAMPPHGPLYWVQTFGPLLPLMLLVLTLLLALAARAVAWSDARGRPWFVSQSDPPPDVSPRLAAHILQTSGALELAGALDAANRARKDRRLLQLEVARSAERTGRIGERPIALLHYLAAPERRAVLQQGLRRVPHGFVRDTFVLGPIALTLVQWGLVRQLSYQVPLAIVWWPVAFVLVSSVLAVIVLILTLSARPLTERGALVRQYLLGVRDYVRQTNFVDRATLSAKLLPYAVLVVPARRAGAQVVKIAEAALADEDATRGWRSTGYLTPARLLIRILAPSVVVAAIVVAATVPVAASGTPDYASYSGEQAGTGAWHADSASFAATLARTSSGHARLSVEEQITATFETDSAQVPQFTQEWPAEYDGQSVGLKVSGITVDGISRPFSVRRNGATLLAVTRMSTPLAGRHDIDVTYTVASAAVAAETGRGTVDRVRWAALLAGWDTSSGWGDSESPITPLRLSITVPNGLGKSVTSSGWLGTRQMTPFGGVTRALFTGEHATESTTSSAGATKHTVQLFANKDGVYPVELTGSDLGAELDFPSGTFAGPDAGALRSTRFLGLLPSLASMLAGLIALVLAVIGIVSGVRRRPWVFARGVARDCVDLLAPALGLTSVILFGWASAHLQGDEPQFAPMIVIALLSLTASVVAVRLTWRTRAPKPV